MRAVREAGGLITLEDLAQWKVKIEEPVHVSYKGIEVYKLTTWVQGPVMLQALNILENVDLKSMGYNSARYIHTLYQAMNLAYADRDFYYGDPAFPPVPPIRGLLSKDYARAAREAHPRRPQRSGRASRGPVSVPARHEPLHGDPRELAQQDAGHAPRPRCAEFDRTFRLGTTSVEAADEKGWAVSVTPQRRLGAGGDRRPHRHRPLASACRASCSMPADNPYNVVEPGKRPRATLTPTLALKDGKPYLIFSVQGGDTQDQNLLQFFLDVVEFGMTVQEATEAANITSYQMRDSFGAARVLPRTAHGEPATPPGCARELHAHGLHSSSSRSAAQVPINAIMVDRAHGTLWGGSSNHGEDYGIGW